MQQIEIINKILPDFKIESYKVLNIGANSTALMVNGDYIFRFPLDKSNFDNYLREKKILDIINSYIRSTQIPKLNVYQYGDMYFTQHKMIPGTDYIKVNNPSGTLKNNLSKDIAQFLYELHSINSRELDFVETKQFDANAYGLDGEQNRLNLVDLLGDNCIGDINSSMDYLNNYNSYNVEDNVICHDDLHEENILVNDNGLSGVIDFGCVVKRKRDVDFANLFEYDPDLAFMTIKEYEKLTGKKIDIKYVYNVQKVRCYGLLAWFIRNNNTKYIELFKKFITNLNNINLP